VTPPTECPVSYSLCCSRSGPPAHVGDIHMLSSTHVRVSGVGGGHSEQYIKQNSACACVCARACAFTHKKGGGRRKIGIYTHIQQVRGWKICSSVEVQSFSYFDCRPPLYV